MDRNLVGGGGGSSGALFLYHILQAGCGNLDALFLGVLFEEFAANFLGFGHGFLLEVSEIFVDELLSLVKGKFGFFAVESGFDGVREIGDFEILHAHGA